MERILNNPLDQQLINVIIKFNSMLRESFVRKEKYLLKIEIPEFKPNDLSNYTELKIAIDCLRHNYRELLRYLKSETYTPLLKIIYLHSEENAFPVVLNLNLNLKEYLEQDFFVGREILKIKKIQ